LLAKARKRDRLALRRCPCRCLSRESLMSMHAHLEELVKRHRALEKEIETENASSASSDLRINELKRKKLLLKDEIEKLRQDATVPTMH
jgi:hypothetical protein